MIIRIQATIMINKTLNMRKTIIAIFVFFTLGISAYGQDPYFSQYFMSPTTLNPALIGSGVSNARVMTVYRSQWWGASPSAYSTYTASAEMRFMNKKSELSPFSLAVSAVSDASNSGFLKNNYFSTGLCYDQPLDADKSQLSLGVTLGYGNRMIDASKAKAGDQFGSLGYSAIISNDPAILGNKHYVDFSSGLQYNYLSKKTGVKLGAALFHIAQPREFNKNTQLINMKLRFTANASVVKKYNGGDELYAMGTYTNHGVNNIVTLGAMYKFKFADQHVLDRFNVGVFDRINDAYVGYLGFEQKAWSFGFSYDLIKSDIQTYFNSVQSMEFSLGWLVPSKKRPSKESDSFHLY